MLIESLINLIVSTYRMHSGDTNMDAYFLLPEGASFDKNGM